MRKNQTEKSEMKELLELRRHMIISIVFLFPLAYLSMHQLLQEWFGIPIPQLVMNAFHGNQNVITYTMTQFLLTLPIMYANRSYHTKGLKNLLQGSPDMDSLIAMGSSVAVIYGIFAIYRIGYGLGSGHYELIAKYSDTLYFESAGMILTLVTIGKYLEEKSKRKTKKAITKLMDLSPKTAVVDQYGQETVVDIKAVRVGDTFILRPGDVVPVDGMIIEGTSGVDESAITGESIPVDKKPGDRVVSASINMSGNLRCKATEVGEDTTIAKIIKLVEKANASKAPIAKLADKIAGIFVPIVILLAILTFAAWYLSGYGLEFAVSNSIAVLVMSCPCALGLATPISVMVGTDVGARNGILIKSGEALQLAQEIDTVVLDKTGTITEGKLRVSDIISFSDKINQSEVMKLAASIEEDREHPITKAIIERAMDCNGKIYRVKQSKTEFGKGVQGEIEEKGLFFLGNRIHMNLHKILVTEEQGQRMEQLASEGKTPLLLADSSKVIGLIGVSDMIKESSMSAIQNLKKMGIEVIMLTGDNRCTAQAVATQVGEIEVVADVLPEDKERKITELRNRGRKVAMVGDGVNDAPALAAADVGIAIGAGTDVALESADIILMRSSLSGVSTAIRLSKKVIRNSKENLFWASFYNILGIPLAAGLLYKSIGMLLNPMFCALAMTCSSIFVLGNAFRINGFVDKD